MEKRITILGEDIAIRFNMAVELAYEEIADRPFLLEDMEYQKNSIALYTAAIITNNPDTKITFDRLITEATGEDIKVLGGAVISCMREWMNIPSVIPEEKRDDDDQPKN